MTQSLVRGLALAAAIFAVTAADAHAGWYSSGGSSSGSWGGSSGSSGGSWGSHGGSRGGGLFSRIHARMHARHSSGGSSGGSSSSYSSHGSWGSSGGSSSSYSSWGSSGGSSSSYSSHGSWGSSGGSSSSSGGYVAPYAAPADGYYDGGAPTPPPSPPNGDANDAPAPPEPPMARADSGVLTVSVPADARVYVNGARTTSTGAWRHYVSRGLRSGYKYAYEVRAELVRDGRTIEETKTVEMRAGETNRLAFDFDDDVTTTLTLKVPEGAKVKLSGAETTSTGPVRTFSTNQLQPGQAWSDYVIQVAWDNDGETVVKEQTITLSAGDSQTLEFGGAEKLAAAR